MKKLLYVDDDPDDRDICKRVLEKAGYQVVVAGSAPAAVQAISVQPIDCAILDYRMPRLDGIAVAQALKQVRPDLPICLFTGLSCLNDQSRGMIDQVISKADGLGALVAWLTVFSQTTQPPSEPW